MSATHVYPETHPLTVSSHELFDEYTRRQFVSKAPEKPNPFGAEETPASFASFDVFTKVCFWQPSCHVPHMH